MSKSLRDVVTQVIKDLEKDAKPRFPSPEHIAAIREFGERAKEWNELLDSLVAQLPGADPRVGLDGNWSFVLPFLSREYGLKPQDIARLTDPQLASYLEDGVRRSQTVKSNTKVPETGLDAYYAEVQKIEDEWYEQFCKEQRVFGSSCWHSRLDELRKIDARHGINPDDPRVYSITAFLREKEQIERAWQKQCKEHHWKDIQEDSPGFSAFWAAQGRCWARLDDCEARHFPGWCHKIGSVDSPRKLWAQITLHLLIVRDQSGAVLRRGSGLKYATPTYKRSTR